MQPWVKLDTQSSSLARVEKKFGLIPSLQKRKERDEKGLKSVKREKKTFGQTKAAKFRLKFAKRGF